MKKKYACALYIFRKDLRLTDNSALIHACQNAQYVLPIFCFDPRQMGKQNKLASSHALQFMCESLDFLAREINKLGGLLYFFYGYAEHVVQQLIDQYSIDALFFNKDYTPFSVKRDQAMTDLCKKKGIAVHASFDAMLVAPELVLQKTGRSYSVFTHFFKAASLVPVSQPQPFPSDVQWYKKPIERMLSYDQAYALCKQAKTDQLAFRAATSGAYDRIALLAGFKDYEHTRDIPSLETTRLSAHIKFGTVSIREVYWAIVDVLATNHPLIRQLYWHDFFLYTMIHHQNMLTSCLRSEYNTLQWSNDLAFFQAWKDGKTGFPIVDAGMRELNQTGFMHNRVRMITASFLVKDLHIDWRWGQNYFAQKLADYDPAVNAGNWQWVASVGIDAQCYLRIFNPWLGQKKYDPGCVYIKKWVKELSSYDSQTIHSWYTQDKMWGKYPQPIVDHAVQRVYTLAQYKK